MLVTLLESHSMASLIGGTQALQERSDSSWIRQALFIPGRSGANVNARAFNLDTDKQFSYNRLGFADTSLGGNRSINPKPQFTNFADPNLPSLLAKTVNNGNPSMSETMGMGRYYAETIDQHAQRIYLQFGVPAYNSLSNYFTMFYDSGHSAMANSGIVNHGILYSFSKFVGMVTVWAVVPGLATLNLLYTIATKVVADAQRRPLSKFYYMKPTMALYWSTVQTIVNGIAVNMGIAQGVDPYNISRETDQNMQVSNAATYGQSAADIKALSSILPDIFLKDSSGLDVRAVANRYQRLHDAHLRKLDEFKKLSSDETQLSNRILAYLNSGLQSSDIQAQYKTLGDYISAYVDSTSGKGDYLIDKDIDSQIAGVANASKSQGDNVADTARTQAANGVVITKTGSEGEKSFWTGLTQHFSNYYDYAIAELRDGSAFVSFIVDYEQHVSESFNNSSRESDIASTMNEQSRSARAKLFNVANGNLLGGTVVGDIVGQFVKAGSDILNGFAEGFGISGIALLGGKAFADIPEFWDSSSVNLPSSNYTIPLRTPYGNPVCNLMYIITPLAMLIAGAAPRSTGRNSYTGPFLCKLYQKGRTQIQLGMINSLSINRGAGNAGWNIHGQATGIDVNVSIVNLSKILHIPISTDLTVSDLVGLTMFDEDNNYTDYLAVLASLGLSEQYYASSRWRIRRARSLQNFDTTFSVNALLSWGANDTTVGSLISIFARKGSL